ncbi:MAG: hypothetical protein K2I98_02840, partial [Prevotella sp.]|nr:hypothetical protein [Prevotella sp.]
LAQPHFCIKASESYTIDLRPYFAGFKSFTVVNELPSTDNGLICESEGATLKVTDLIGNRLATIAVTVRDSQTGYVMTRQFNFAVSDRAVELGISSPLPSTANSQQPTAVIYDLQGRQLGQPQKGINIQQGKKFFSK